VQHGLVPHRSLGAMLADEPLIPGRALAFPNDLLAPSSWRFFDCCGARPQSIHRSRNDGQCAIRLRTNTSALSGPGTEWAIGVEWSVVYAKCWHQGDFAQDRRRARCNNPAEIALTRSDRTGVTNAAPGRSATVCEQGRRNECFGRE
jgi:hypothetical protein